MKEKVSSGIFLIMVFVSILTLVSNVQVVGGESTMIYVDDDNIGGPWYGTQNNPYQNISSGLNHAGPGDTIFVKNGTYYEHLNVSKSVTLVGENRFGTIIDGSGQRYLPIINVNATKVVIENFTIQNTSSDYRVGGFGILASQTSNITIRNNIVRRSEYGIQLRNTSYSKILDNRIVNNYDYAIDFVSGSSYNQIISNVIEDNTIPIYIEQPSCKNNTFYRNSFLNNTKPVDVFAGSTSWDNGAEGNYWDDYEGNDLDGDGVGDTRLPHQWVDWHPLIEPWNETRTFFVFPEYEVTVNCNYTVASFAFNQTLGQISFYITGPYSWTGYCNVTIPKELLSPENSSEKWMVMLGQRPLTHTTEDVDNSTRISFTYTLGSSLSENRVRIKAGPPLYPPTADFEFTPDPASIIEPVNFTDTSIDSPDGTIVWRQWNFGDGNTTETNEKFVRHRFKSKEVFHVTLTVKDENNLIDSLTKPVNVSNLEPWANFTFLPSELSVGLEAILNASRSIDLDGNITEYRWDFDDGNVTVTTYPTVAHKFEHADYYTVTLKVRDNDGAENTSRRILQVGKGTTSVEVNAPTSAKVTEVFEVKVILRDQVNRSLAGEQIGLFVYNDELILSQNTTTDDNGEAVTIISLDLVGEYMIKTDYLGSDDYFGSNRSKLIMVNRLDTSLTLLVSENATQNEELTMFATLADESERPVHNATIEFYFQNGSAWESLGSSKTNQSGVASFNYIPQQAGTLTLKALFNGTETYAASNEERSLRVIALETDYSPYIISVAAIVAVVLLVYLALRRRSSSDDPSKTREHNPVNCVMSY